MQKTNVKCAALTPPAGSGIFLTLMLSAESLPEQMANKWRSLYKTSNPLGGSHAYLICHL